MCSHSRIRNANSDPNSDPQSGLRLRLEEFGPSDLIDQQTPLNEELFIPLATLSMYLDTAEYSQSKTKTGTGVRQAIKPGTGKWRRESTPPEQLNDDDDDDDRFQAEEERAEECTDSSYHGSS